MNAHKKSLGNIFEPSMRLVAPLFQRPYVWTGEKNWEPLWDAVAEVADRRLAGQPSRPHFLGAIVLDQVRVPAGDVDARQLIDGQQRLTTLQVMLAAARDVCQTVGATNFREAFERLTVNYVPSSNDPDLLFKVWPTNVDRPHFRRAMTVRSPQEIRKQYAAADGAGDVGHLIPAAYLYFHAKVADWLAAAGDGEPDARLRALHAALNKDMSLVVIDLDDDDDAQEIFETLNFLGTPLLPADLVKNFLFQAVESAGLDTQKLYEAYWQPFDVQSVYWRKEVGQGRSRRPRIDLFLQHYLTLVSGREVNATHLFGAFREFARSNKGITATKHLEQLHDYAAVYQSFDKFPAGSPEAVFFDRLETLDTSSVFPLLLELFRDHGDPARRVEARAVLGDLESFLVRRTVCGLTTKSYSRLILDLIKRLREAGEFSAARVREFLAAQDAESNRWPTDEEFEAAWLHKPLYRLKQARVRMLLEAVDLAMQTSKTEKVRVGEKLTIEHILPQSWQASWPLAPALEPREAERRREAAIHTLGNLTLVTEALNPSISNGPWEAKRKAMEVHCALTLNRRLLSETVWNEERIAERGRELFGLAQVVWGRPPAPATGRAWASAEVGPGDAVEPGDPDAAEHDGGEPSAAGGGRESRREYWVAFKRHLEGARSDLNPEEPKGTDWYQFHTEWKGVIVEARRSPADGQIGVFLKCTSRASHAYAHLRADQVSVEREVGLPLTWVEDNRGSGFVRWFMPADPSDRSAWPQQFEHLQAALERIRDVIVPRLKELDRR